MAPLPFPTIIVPTNTSSFHTADTASLPSSSLAIPGSATTDTCGATHFIESFQEELCPMHLISNISEMTSGSQGAGETLFITTRSATTAQSVPTETRSAPINIPAIPVKRTEQPSAKKMDTCGLGDLVLTGDDSFMCIGEDGHLLPVGNADVLAKIRAAKPGIATFCKPTPEDTEAAYKTTDKNAIQLIFFGLLMVPTSAAGCLLSYFWYKQIRGNTEIDALRKNFMRQQAADLWC